MFKLESYITPLILSRVEKYVKNVRTEDSQVYKCFNLKLHVFILTLLKILYLILKLLIIL